jgi:hypothetical protein
VASRRQHKRQSRQLNRRQSRRLIAGTLLALALWPSAALANGRFPAADQILVEPGEPSHLALRATFGVLQSRDAGRSWSWICEAAVGYMGDPALALLGGGNLLAGFFGSVAVSAEQGCGWHKLTLDTQYQYAFDSTLDPADPSRAWVLTVSVDGTRQVSLLAVDASGAIQQTLPVGQGFVPSTVEVAPSDPARIYVTGAIENAPSIVMRSEDGGQNWSRFSFDAYGSLPLFISAIDPNNPDLLYARVDNQPAAGPPGMAQSTQRQPPDHLLVSRDAGETWDTVFSLDGDLFGFALSPDGSRIATGGPDQGVYLARASDLDFQPVPAPVRGLRCLRWTDEGLLACGQESLDGWTVGLSRDEGQSFEPLWHVQDLSPLQCAAATTTGAACPSAWPDIARTIGAQGGDPIPPGIEPAPAPAPGSSGCALRVSAADSGRVAHAAWLPLAAVLGWLSYRRRVSSRRQGTSM